MSKYLLETECVSTGFEGALGFLRLAGVAGAEIARLSGCGRSKFMVECVCV